MFFIGQKKHQSESMNRFNRLPEFEKELKKLIKKYRSLEQDLKDMEQILVKTPIGIGKNFTIIHQNEQTTIIKTRLACASLKNRSARVIYAYHKNSISFVYIELYFKGEKSNEDFERVKSYLEKTK